MMRKMTVEPSWMALHLLGKPAARCPHWNGRGWQQQLQRGWMATSIEEKPWMKLWTYLVNSGWLYRLGFHNIQEVVKYGSSRKFDLKKLGANWGPQVPKNRIPQLLKACQRKEGAFKLWWKWVCKQMLLATWSRDGTSKFPCEGKTYCRNRCFCCILLSNVWFPLEPLADLWKSKSRVLGPLARHL
jgi:hypothetical protein